jgi:hypothetical protein
MRTHRHRFYKENEKWYIDLPEFLERGLGTQANLQMVGGSDEYLEVAAQFGQEVTLLFADEFWGFGSNIDTFHRTAIDKDDAYLESVGHPAVDSGAYYNLEGEDFQIWLCPVTKYVFGGDYPETIYVTVD